MKIEDALEVLGYLLGHEKSVDSGELDGVQNCLNSQEQEALKVILSEFRELKEKRDCKNCAGCTVWKCDCANTADKAIEDFANFIHEKAKENNGLRLSSETRSWTHPSIFDYLDEFKTSKFARKSLGWSEGKE